MRTSPSLAGSLALLLLLAVACSGPDDGSADPTEPVASSAPAVTAAADPSETVAADGGTRDTGTDGTGGESVLVEEVPDLGVDVDPLEPVSWTYLVISLSDTDLEQFMLADVAEMATVGSSPDVNVVALVDREAGHTDEALLNLEDWETAKVLYVDPGELFEVADIGEVDMGDPHTLASFLEFGLRTFPADHVALTISDHGGGWTGIGPDDSSGEVLDLQEIASALDAALAVADVERLDLLGFDACLMATYEVASTLAPYADLLLASEELEPGHGWDYGALSTIVEDPSTDPATLGAAFVEGFQGQADASGTGAEITLSLVDLAGLAALDEALAAFAAVLADNVEALGVLVGRQLADNVSYGRSPDPAQSTHLTDLGQFVAEIGVASLQVSDPADAVLRAINDVVLAQTVGPARLGSTGLSIYFPPVLELTDGRYQQVAAAEAWVQFLIAYYTSGLAIPPEGQPAIAGEARSGGAAPSADAPIELGATDAGGGEVVTGEAIVEQVEGGVEVSVALEPAALPNITEAYLSFGYIDPEDGAIVQLGDTDAEVLEDGTVVGFSDLTVLTLTDADGDTVEAYLGLEVPAEGDVAYASVPLDYLPADAEEWAPVDLSIVLDAETGDVLQEVYYLIDEDAGTYGELDADPAALIAPVVLVYLPDGTAEWQPYGDQALFADLPSLTYGLEPLEPGTEVYVDLTVTDYGGNQLIASATFVLE